MRTHTGKMPITLYLYVARECLMFFIVSFLFFFVMFFINQILYMATDILSKKAPLFDVIKLMVFALPSIVAMSFPYATLLGSFMSIGRFVSEREFLVINASGISNVKLFIPFVVLGILSSTVSFVMNDFFLPLGMMNYQRVYRNLILSTPALELKPFSVKKYQDSVIVTGEMNKNSIRDIVVIDRTKDGKNRVITAHNARINNSDKNADVLVLMLEDVTIQENESQYPDRFEYTHADKMEYNIVLTQFSSSGSMIGASEMGVANLMQIINKKRAETAGTLLLRENEYVKKHFDFSDRYFSKQYLASNLDNRYSSLKQDYDILLSVQNMKGIDRGLEIYKLELYKKLAIPFAAICFVFLAFPLGISSKKSSIGRNFGIGLGIVLANWFLLLGGQFMVVRGFIPAFWGIWFANILTVCVGVIFFFIRFKR